MKEDSTTVSSCAFQCLCWTLSFPWWLTPHTSWEGFVVTSHVSPKGQTDPIFWNFVVTPEMLARNAKSIMSRSTLFLFKKACNQAVDILCPNRDLALGSVG